MPVWSRRPLKLLCWAPRSCASCDAPDRLLLFMRWGRDAGPGQPRRMTAAGQTQSPGDRQPVYPREHEGTCQRAFHERRAPRQPGDLRPLGELAGTRASIGNYGWKLPFTLECGPGGNKRLLPLSEVVHVQRSRTLGCFATCRSAVSSRPSSPRSRRSCRTQSRTGATIAACRREPRHAAGSRLLQQRSVAATRDRFSGRPVSTLNVK